MKLVPVFAKYVGSKVKVLSVLGGLAMAGAAMTVAAPAAQAQVAFGVEVGGPRYYAPAPPPHPVYVAPEYGYGYGPGPQAYWEHRRFEDWRAREWHEHQDWDRRHDFPRYQGYYGGGWR